MEADSGINLAALKVDGGASANNFLMQTQADIINAPVNRPCCVETTAMGAAYLAGLAVGYWSSKEEVRQNWSIDQKFYPSITEEARHEKVKGWKQSGKIFLWMGKRRLIAYILSAKLNKIQCIDNLTGMVVR